MLSLEAKPKSPFSRNHLIRDALGQALYDAMREDQAIHLFGEGCEVKVHYDAPAIERDFASRLHTMPISEDGNLNFAVGTAIMGVKPVVDVIAGDFLYRCLDSLCNTAAKLDFVTGRHHTMVVRAEFLLGGPTTGQRPEAMLCHIPGINVLMPSTPYDAYGLMRTALKTPGVTVVLEDRMIEDAGPWQEGDEGISGAIPMGQASIRLDGVRGGPLVLTYGYCRQVVEAALADHPTARVIDLRSLYPVDWNLLEWCMSRHQDVLIVEPDVVYGGIGAEIVAQMAERYIATKFKRIGMPRETIPASPALHGRFSLGEEEILHALRFE